VLLDLSFSNLFLENLGTSIENLLNLTNLIIFNRSALNFENIANLINILNI
jgi:hypothetical protein